MNNTPSKLSDTVRYLTTFPHLNYFPEFKVTTNFTIGEYKEATKKLASEWEKDDRIPVESNVVDLNQYIRESFGKPLYLGSVYRTEAWDKSKGRSGDSRHTFAEASDLNDKDKHGFRDWFINQVEENTNFIKTCQSMGLTRAGFYDWGIHIDTKYTGTSELFVFDKRTKKTRFGLTTILALFGLAIGSKIIS